MLSRRQILAALGALPAASVLGSGPVYGQAAAYLPKRTLGRTGRQVVPYALGGIGALNYPVEGADSADIIVRAVQLGINYLDTANYYGPSQMYYGEAFRRLHLTPTDPNYNLPLREGLYVAAKTLARYSFNPPPLKSYGPPPPPTPNSGQPVTAIDELKRSLTQIFGDGKGFIPEGAYLDCIQIHYLGTMEHVDQIYEGMAERGASKRPERFGALAGLLDYRDGTNYTGLNPEHRVWVRHIGITGHNSPVVMRAVRLDNQDIIDTVLIPLNANDRNYSSNQNNIVPLAVARGMGIIAMKLFSAGAMYGGPKHSLHDPKDLISSVGKAGMVPPHDLIRYPLSIPGVTCAVVGIGRINRDKPEEDQLVANLAAGVGDMPSEADRRRIERDVAQRQGTDTNYFQEKQPGITQPTAVRTRKDADRIIVEWNTAIAGPEPIRSYEIRAGQRLLLSLPYRPQLTEASLSAFVRPEEVGNQSIIVVAST